LVVLMLAGFYALIEWKGWRRWAFPLVVVGMNSIAVYVMSWTMEPYFRRALQIHLGWLISAVAGPTFQPIFYGLGVMLIFWLVLFWMYRRKVFVRI
jgi:heparan-alpha-glucosaminide N-acetyltransferase